MTFYGNTHSRLRLCSHGNVRILTVQYFPSVYMELTNPWINFIKLLQV